MAMNNAQIADKLELLADLLEFQGANPFRTRAYRNGARAIRDLGETVAAIVQNDNRTLTDVEGIGTSVAEKCRVLVETGELPQLNQLLAEVPESVLALLRIPGLGPKKAAVLFQELKITTLGELKAACESGAVRELKGFGAKTEQAILDGMAIAEAASQRIYWSEADVIAQTLLEHLRGCPHITKMELAGSYRRGRETVGDLDVLVVTSDIESAMDRFGEFPEVASVLARGGTKMSVRLESGFQIDLRAVPEESFGAALQYFTGSKEHNVVVRGRAKQLGLKINEWGVFQVDGDKETYIAGATEQDVYATLDLPLIPPELRENRLEFELAEQGLPELIQVDDIRGDLHMHTTATDGKASLSEMVAAARRRGLKYIAITDHSQRVSMARGLTADRLRRQWEEIDQLNEELGKSFTILKGIECDILEKGGMDLPDDVLAEADWVLASVHYGQRQSREEITARIHGAMENP